MRNNHNHQIGHIPREIRVISTLYILDGILTLLTSIYLVVMGYISRTVGNGGGQGIVALLLFPFFVGTILTIGISLGRVIISTGVDLKKMKKSAFIYAYFFTGLWILIGLLIVINYIPIIFSLTDFIFSSIGVLIIIFSLINGVYLYRVRHYFRNNLD
jgi:hypothetical protein